ncbi:hypothetical protein ACFVVM_25250 [Nocardia sp. NPDC058176]|uniref:hypothetical protein n=1 Tax=Nocardia sp. NPDC058176 TaxID=3346368 RepID=UPI0036D8F3A5
MANRFDSPAGWTPPGSQFQSSSTVSRTLIGAFLALVVTPIGMALAAHGALATSRWVILGDAADRFGSSLQVIGGALLLLLVSALAGYTPVATILAGLVWGVLPGLIYFVSPESIWRLVGDLPLMTDELHVALNAWITSGFTFVAGLLLVGAGVAGTLRRR